MNTFHVKLHLQRQTLSFVLLSFITYGLLQRGIFSAEYSSPWKQFVIEKWYTDLATD